jgi:hypothetical protein
MNQMAVQDYGFFPQRGAYLNHCNLFKEMAAPCPARWQGLVRLYRNIYDTVRPQADSRTKIFATLTLQQLLGYGTEICHGPLVFETCTGDPAPSAFAAPVPEICYPLDLSAISDLDQGNRLEILALSFFPDGLMMDVGDGILDAHTHTPYILFYICSNVSICRGCRAHLKASEFQRAAIIGR